MSGEQPTPGDVGRPDNLTGACEKFYPRCCSYHQGWEDAKLHRGELVFVLAQENKRLRDAILDIDAHASPFGEDEDGFVDGGYLISVGCLHRALGIVGHTAPKAPESGASRSDNR